MLAKKFKKYNQNIQYNFLMDCRSVYEKRKIIALLHYHDYFDICDIDSVDINSKIIHCNTTKKWIIKNKDKIKNKLEIYGNPNFELDWLNIDKESDIDYIFETLSYNPNFKKSWILNFPNERWNYNKIVLHKNFDLDCFNTIKSKIDYIEFWERYIYKSPNLDITWIDTDYPWNYDRLILSDNFTPRWYHKFKKLFSSNFIHNYKEYIYTHKNFNINWIKELGLVHPDFKLISSSYNLDESWLKKFPNANWDTNAFKTNKNYSSKWLIKYPNLFWNPYFYQFKYRKAIIEESDFKIEMFLENPLLNWNYYQICKSKYFSIDWIHNLDISKLNFINIIKNSNFEIEWVRQYPYLDWCFLTISTSQKFQISWIEMFPLAQWSYRNIINNDNFKIEWLEVMPKLKDFIACYDMSKKNFEMKWLDIYPDLAWNYAKISKAKDLTYEFVIRNPELKWNKYDLLLNDNFMRSFTLYNLRFFFKCVKIQKWWLDIYYSPITEVGKKRLKRKYDEMLEY
tara:strand:- start:88 stop:1620 length:1533 start_codon:yes stop_codon:yes gene_type:complete